MTVEEFKRELETLPGYYILYLNGSPVTALESTQHQGVVELTVEAYMTGSHCPTCHQKVGDDDE